MNLKKVLAVSILWGLFISSCVYARDYVDGYLMDDYEISQWNAIGVPSVSPTDTARMYYNGTDDTLDLSLNGMAYSALTTLSSADTRYVNVTGDTMTGNLSLGSNDLTAGTGTFSDAGTSTFGGDVEINGTLDIYKATESLQSWFTTYGSLDADYSRIYLQHSETDTALAMDATSSNSYLGYIGFNGVNTGSDFTYGSRIYSRQIDAAGAGLLNADLWLNSYNIKNMLFDNAGVCKWSVIDSDGAEVASVNSDGTLTAPTINFGSTTGVSATATNGVLTIAGLKSGGLNENLIIDFENGAPNTIVFNSASGATTWNVNAITLQYPTIKMGESYFYFGAPNSASLIWNDNLNLDDSSPSDRRLGFVGVEYRGIDTADIGVGLNLIPRNVDANRSGKLLCHMPVIPAIDNSFDLGTLTEPTWENDHSPTTNPPDATEQLRWKDLYLAGIGYGNIFSATTEVDTPNVNAPPGSNLILDVTDTDANILLRAGIDTGNITLTSGAGGGINLVGNTSITGTLGAGATTLSSLTVGSLAGMLKGTAGVVGTATDGTDYLSSTTGRKKVAKVLIVDADGKGDYTTIAAAIAAASSGFLIKVMPGTYAESNQTLPDGVDLQGSGRGVSIIQAGSSLAIIIASGNNRISDLTIINTYASGGVAFKDKSGGATNVFIYNVELSGSYDGILLSASSGTWIFDNCHWLDCKYDGGNVSASNLIIKNSTAIFSPYYVGICSFMYVLAGTTYIENCHIQITREANEQDLSFVRAETAGTIYSRNNNVIINAGTKNAYGFIPSIYRNPTFYSYGDTFSLTGSTTYHFAGDTTNHSGICYYEGGNLTTWNSEGTFTALQQGTLSSASLLSTTGAISFGDENLSTKGTLGAGATTLSANSTTALKVNDGLGKIVSTTIASGGTGYTVNDVLTITGGGGNATVVVLSVSSGVVNGLRISAVGTGYSTASTVATTGGTGANCTLNINVNNVTIDTANQIFGFGGLPTQGALIEGGSATGRRTGLKIDFDDNSYGPTLAGYCTNDTTERIFFRGVFTAGDDQRILFSSGSIFGIRYKSAAPAAWEFGNNYGTNPLLSFIAGVSDATADISFKTKTFNLIGGTDTDIPVNFTGTTHSGLFTWMEDEDYFQFGDGILIPTGEQIYFRDTAIYIQSTDDGWLNLVADTGVEINAPIINTPEIYNDGLLTNTGGIIFPDADPHIVGAWWNSAGTLVMSAG